MNTERARGLESLSNDMETYTRRDVIDLVNMRNINESKYSGVQLPFTNLSGLDLRALPFEKANFKGCNLENVRYDVYSQFNR
jgi:uncharacterized protein YjbI with pentapeptide repeats